MNLTGFSAHHGAINEPNRLRAARQVLRENEHEISVMEIDFISFRGTIVSSHDYDYDVISLGSRLETWVQLVVLDYRCVLWMDLKENSVLFNWMYGEFDVPLLFRTLSYLEARHPNLKQYIWLSSQSRSLRKKLIEANTTLEESWTLLLDMPTVKNYIYKTLIPPCFSESLLPTMVSDEFEETPYRHYPILALDQTFFPDRGSLIEFIRKLRLKRDTIVILNSFAREVKPIRIKGLHIIMQYDYTVNLFNKG